MQNSTSCEGSPPSPSGLAGRNAGLGRRGFLGGIALAGAGQMLAATAAQAESPAPAVAPAAVVTAQDARYKDLVVGNNARWSGTPKSVVLPSLTSQVEAVVQRVAKAGQRLSVKGGGHCYADFVFNSQIDVVLDMSRLDGVSWDADMGAFAVEAGGTLLNVYEKLYKGWGVTIPGGMCYSVGVGGHVAGGGYGLLSRRNGTSIDHLYAIEVVRVDSTGAAKTIRATRETTDANRELWWAHTGGGGGNFGVVTKYWFRSPGMSGKTAGSTLMRPPSSLLVSGVGIPWSAIDKSKYQALVEAFGTWHEKHAASSDPGADLCSFLMMNHQSNGSMGLLTTIDATVPDARKIITDFISSILSAAGLAVAQLDQPVGEVGAMPGFAAPVELPWMHAMQLLGTNNPTLTDPTARGIHKSAYLRKKFTPTQTSAMYKQLTRSDLANPKSMIVLLSYGGKINDVAADATASVQRGSIFKGLFQSFWNDPQQDKQNLTWTRDAYGEVFTATGGYPAQDEATQGCYINYPDSDIVDSTVNTSGRSFSELYYGSNYPRLQKAKAAFDPKNFFRNSQSIQLPGAS